MAPFQSVQDFQTVQDFQMFIATLTIRGLLQLKKEMEKYKQDFMKSIMAYEEQLQKLNNTLQNVDGRVPILYVNIQIIESLKAITSKKYDDIAFKLDMLCEMLPIFKVEKEGDKSLFYNRFFSSRKERFILYYKGNIYYFSDRECTELKGTIKLEGSEKWGVTGCDVTITQPDRVWELTFDNDGDAKRFKEICEQ